jgi:chorismate mutase
MELNNMQDTIDWLDRKCLAYNNGLINLDVVIEALRLYGQHNVADLLLSTFNDIETEYIQDQKQYYDLTGV